MIELPGLWSLTPLGFGIGVVALFYWLLATGRLIPRSTHNEIVAAQKDRGDGWKETALRYQGTNDILLKHNGDLIDSNKVVEQLIKSSGPSLSDTIGGG